MFVGTPYWESRVLADVGSDARAVSKLWNFPQTARFKDRRQDRLQKLFGELHILRGCVCTLYPKMFACAR